MLLNFHIFGLFPFCNTIAQAADLHAALNSLPKSFSSQLTQYAQLSGMPQFAGNPAMAAAFGLAHNAQQQAPPPPPSYASSSKERSAVLSHDRDILSRDRDRDMFNRDRDYYNKVFN